MSAERSWVWAVVLSVVCGLMLFAGTVLSTTSAQSGAVELAEDRTPEHPEEFSRLQWKRADAPPATAGAPHREDEVEAFVPAGPIGAIAAEDLGHSAVATDASVIPSREANGDVAEEERRRLGQTY